MALVLLGTVLAGGQLRFLSAAPSTSSSSVVTSSQLPRSHLKSAANNSLTVNELLAADVRWFSSALPQNDSALYYVHIGKCAGTTTQKWFKAMFIRTPKVQKSGAVCFVRMMLARSAFHGFPIGFKRCNSL